jgi:hypothetical protein
MGFLNEQRVLIMEAELLGYPVIPNWVLLIAVVAYIVIRDRAVQPRWVRYARTAIAVLLGIGGAAEASAFLGISEILAAVLLTLFGPMLLDQLSNPKIWQAFVKSKLGGGDGQ